MAFTRWSRWIQVWILVTLFSLMAYDLYWTNGVYRLIYSILIQNLPNITATYANFYIDFVPGGIADSIRFVAVILFLISAYIVWGPKKKPFTNVRKYVAVALFFEAVYFLAVLPLNIQEIIRGRSPFLLFLAFVIQILVASPLLLALSLKVWRYKGIAKVNLAKWAYISGLGYLIGLWFNNVFKWFSMTQSAGLGFLLKGITSLGFLSTAIFLSLSLIFAFAGFYTFIKSANRKLTLRLLGISLILLGLHFAFYILYSWLAPGAWRFLLLTEIWPLPFLAVGIGMLKVEI